MTFVTPAYLRYWDIFVGYLILYGLKSGLIEDGIRNAAAIKPFGAVSRYGIGIEVSKDTGSDILLPFGLKLSKVDGVEW